MNLKKYGARPNLPPSRTVKKIEEQKRENSPQPAGDFPG